MVNLLASPVQPEEGCVVHALVVVDKLFRPGSAAAPVEGVWPLTSLGKKLKYVV